MAFSFGLHTLSLVLIVVAFAFLLLATIGSPIVQTFNLASTSNVSYGVFGFCQVGGACLKATYPYPPSAVDLTTTDWYLESDMRDTLAKALIVVPIMLGISFITFGVTIVAHFTGLALVYASVLSLLSFAGTAAVGVITILLFTPHVAWTGWLLIAAAGCLLVATAVLFLATFSQGSDREDNNGDVEFNNLLFNLEQKTAMYTFGTSLDKAPPNFLSYKELDSSSTIEHNRATPGSGNSYRQVRDVDLSHTNPPPLMRQYAPINSNLPYRVNGQPDFVRSHVSDESPLGEMQMNDVTRPNFYAYNGVGTEQNSEVPSVPQLRDSPNTPIQIRQQMAPLVAPRVATPSRQPQPAPYPVSVAPFSPDVFEHHSQVEGHQPFTQEYVDDDNGYRNTDRGADSDTELDFTSVSQRAPNPQYMDPARRAQVPNGNPSYGYQPQPNYQFAQSNSKPSSYSGGYAPFMQGYAPQQRQPTLSETVLSNNPDFGVGAPPKRKTQPGFVPVSQRNKPGMLASALMGRR